MKNNQKFTPKYWVGHSRDTDDIFINTANKWKAETEQMMQEDFGRDWWMNDNYEIILIEVKHVDLKGIEQ